MDSLDSTMLAVVIACPRALTEGCLLLEALGEYVCRQCLCAYESFDASKKKIILGLTKAIEFFPGYDAGETSTSPKAVTPSPETVSPFSRLIVQATKVSSL